MPGGCGGVRDEGRPAEAGTDAGQQQQRDQDRGHGDGELGSVHVEFLAQRTSERTGATGDASKPARMPINMAMVINTADRTLKVRLDAMLMSDSVLANC